MDNERTMKCECCHVIFREGQGVDHELDDGSVIVFCSMDHFKSWVRENGKASI